MTLLMVDKSYINARTFGLSGCEKPIRDGPPIKNDSINCLFKCLNTTRTSIDHVNYDVSMRAMTVVAIMLVAAVCFPFLTNTKCLFL